MATKQKSAKKKTARSTPAKLRKAALSLPGTNEGTSCNKAAFKAGAKNFFFMGEGKGPERGAFTTMLKLTDSLAAAKKLAKAKPDNYSVGGAGWVNAEFDKGDGPPAGLLEGWIEESYRALAPKKLVAELDG